MFQRILIVCSGNICRSPFAQAMMMKIMPTIQVQSAGTVTALSELEGHHADPRMNEAAQLYNVDLKQHQARQLTPELCAWSDAILVMEHTHLSALLKIDASARGKSFILGQWGEGSIEDPYAKEQHHFVSAAKQIESACQSWRRKIQPKD
ncbi:low molecular weight phosphotyrosine protein phosphatase [Vibrio sinensis]|uniref:protein-tyrosine-phosphatase n=1 Tax=Vibrio sinensis TaxID=2302434 RepID=A0A3A6QD66_9VIBR|nr:low molecular weight protein-tyrosine-phosphatase [Vibrio sinensis]RJX69702.1 low molecular weight phosphotyrosine protein phosphatase [Vibrio sinensis]